MGLAVAKALAARGNWDIHILDINEARGAQTAKEIPHVTFHQAEVTKYSDLGAKFQKAFQLGNGRLDFVFANAGVIERANFYASPPAEIDEAGSPPPEPDLASINVDLKGVVLTTYLAQHYFRCSPHGGKGANLVMTASCGGLYPSFYSPLYSAAKCNSSSPLFSLFMGSAGANPFSRRCRVHAVHRPTLLRRRNSSKCYLPGYRAH